MRDAHKTTSYVTSGWLSRQPEAAAPGRSPPHVTDTLPIYTLIRVAEAHGMELASPVQTQLLTPNCYSPRLLTHRPTGLLPQVFCREARDIGAIQGATRGPQQPSCQ
jgi:hypothetical protein